MYTVKEAATILTISVSAVYALCAVGRIRHDRHGVGRGTIRIPHEALDEYRKAAEATTPAPAVRLKHIRT